MLPKEKVTAIPLPRGSSMITDPKHVGYFMYPRTEASYVLPRQLPSGNWVECLTKAEREYLEKELGVNLSFNRGNPYWGTRHVKIKRTEELLIKGFDLDISTPDGYLDYKILTKVPQFAPSWDERNNSMEYRFALVKEGERLSEEYADATAKQDAFEKFSKLKNNKEKLFDFLVRYGLRPDKDSTIEFLRTEVWKLVDKFPEKFNEIVGDTDYETKIFLDKALRCGAIKLIGKTTYALGYGKEDIIGSTLGLAIIYLKDKRNSTTLMEIQARIEGKEFKKEKEKTKDTESEDNKSEKTE